MVFGEVGLIVEDHLLVDAGEQPVHLAVVAFGLKGRAAEILEERLAVQGQEGVVRAPVLHARLVGARGVQGERLDLSDVRDYVGGVGGYGGCLQGRVPSRCIGGRLELHLDVGVCFLKFGVDRVEGLHGRRVDPGDYLQRH